MDPFFKPFPRDPRFFRVDAAPHYFWSEQDPSRNDGDTCGLTVVSTESVASPYVFVLPPTLNRIPSQLLLEMTVTNTGDTPVTPCSWTLVESVSYTSGSVSLGPTWSGEQLWFDELLQNGAQAWSIHGRAWGFGADGVSVPSLEAGATRTLGMDITGIHRVLYAIPSAINENLSITVALRDASFGKESDEGALVVSSVRLLVTVTQQVAYPATCWSEMITGSLRMRAIGCVMDIIETALEADTPVTLPWGTDAIVAFQAVAVRPVGATNAAGLQDFRAVKVEMLDEDGNLLWGGLSQPWLNAVASLGGQGKDVALWSPANERTPMSPFQYSSDIDSTLVMGLVHGYREFSSATPISWRITSTEDLGDVHVLVVSWTYNYVDYDGGHCTSFV